MRHAIVVAFSLAFAGCAQNAWYNPTAKQGQFEVDRYSCIQQSQQRRGVAVVGVYGGSAVDQQITNEPIFFSCMASKGWIFGSDESIKIKVSQDAARHSSVQQKISEIVAKIKQACGADEYREYYSKTPCNVSELTIAQLADESKVTEAQKVALLKQQQTIRAYLSEINKLLLTSGQSGAREAEIQRTIAWPAAEKNVLALYSGKITWGEYNQRRRSISVELQEARRMGR